jgi:hypothetical protein
MIAGMKLSVDSFKKLEGIRLNEVPAERLKSLKGMSLDDYLNLPETMTYDSHVYTKTDLIREIKGYQFAVYMLKK